MTVTVWPVDAIAGVPSYTGRALREAQSVFMAGGTPARWFGVNSGVRPSTNTNSVGATSTTWTVYSHAGILDLETAAEAGAYAYAISPTGGLPTGAVTAADATRPRVDIVWLRLDDPAESDGSAVPAVVAGYTAGVPLAVNPVAPATPARCMVLATLQVPMSGSGAPTVIWTAPYTVAAGGIMPVPAGVYPANPYTGEYVDDPTLGLLRWNGTAWVSFRDSKTNVTLAGSVLVTTSASGNVNVVFGATFASPPVVVGCNGDSTLHNNMTVGLLLPVNTTTTQTTFACRVGETGGIVASTSVQINWTATGNLA